MKPKQNFSWRLLLVVLAAAFRLPTLFATDIEPYVLPVTFSVRITGDQSSLYLTVYDAYSTQISGTWNGTWSPAETGVTTAFLRPGQDYNVSFGSSTSATCAMSFVAPSGYRLYIDGVPSDYKVFQSTLGQPGGVDFKIRLQPILGAGFLDAGVFTGIDIGQAVSWELGAGGLMSGHSVGRVSFREKDLTNSPASRDRLIYTAPLVPSGREQVNAVRDGASSQTLRQLASPQKVLDFVDETVSGVAGYWVKYYNYDDTDLISGVYVPKSGRTPWRTIRVESPASNQLRIIETEGSVSRASHLSLTSGSISSGTYVWTLQEGSVASGTYTWLRTTTHTSTKTGGTRENVVTVRTGGTSGTIVSETKYVYNTYSWGEDLYQVIANPNGSSPNVLTSTYDYYTTAPSGGSDTYRGSFARVKSITGPDGSWTAYEYYDDWIRRGQTSYTYAPDGDSPSTVTLDPTQGRVVSYDYVADSTGRYRWPSLKQEKVGNVATGKTAWSYTGSSLPYIKANTDTYKDGTYYHRTYTETVDPMSGDVNEEGEPSVAKNSDSSQVSWSRGMGGYNSSTKVFTYGGSYFWRELKVTGSTNSSGATSVSSYDSQSFPAVYAIANKSTIDITIRSIAGYVIRTETRYYTGSGWSAPVAAVDSTINLQCRLDDSTALNGATIDYTYTNGYLSSVVGGDGVETQYTQDGIGRTATVKKVGVTSSGIHAAQADRTVTYGYDGASHVLTETVSATGTSETIVTSRAYDLLGRLTSVTPPGLSATTYSYNTPSRTQTATAPDGGTTMQDTYRDGRLKSTTGTAVVPSFLTYSVETDGRKKIQVNAGTSSSTRLQKTWTDWLERPIKLEKPGFSQSSQAAYVEEQFYDNTTGQLTKTTRTGAAPTLYVYNTLGAVTRSGLDVDNGGALVLASNDRIAESDTSFESYSSNLWLKSTSTTYPDAGASTHPITTYSRTRLTGLGSGTLAEQQATDAEGNTVTSVTTISSKLITAQTAVPSMTASDQYDYVYNGVSSASKGHDALTTKLVYDALGRSSTVTDARSLVTTTAYYTGTALPYTVTDSASTVVSTVAYDTQGRTAWTRDAASKYTRFGYNTRGQVIQQWGDGTYPVSYAYDSTYGDRTGMSTYRVAPAADSGSWPSVGTADTTTWTFDTPSGLLWKKTDAVGKHVDMDYNQAGMVARRTLARGVYTNYGYDSATGELLTQTYSDSTPSATYTYTRSGQADSVVDDTGTWDFVYDSTKPWRQASTTLPSFYGTRYWTALYESGGGAMIGRYLGSQLGSSVGSSADLEQGYTYSADGRFDTLASKRSSNSVTRTFDYSYLTNTPFVSGFTITGGHSFSVARGYVSNLNLLQNIDSKWTTTSIARYDYTYDARYQRSTGKQSGTAFADYYVSGSYSAVFNNYTYNARSELQTAAMYCGDTPSTTPSSGDELPGRRFEYRFDSIGNRQNDGPTGDPNNVDDQYTTNALNQYTAKENNTVRFLGTAATTANVGVTGAVGGSGKKDHAWGADLIPSNTSTAVLGTGNVSAAIPGGGAGGGDLVKSLSKAYFVPKAAQTFAYDDDGNLTNDSVWDYTYDAENRLIAMQNRSEVIGSGMIASADARKLVFKYDYQGRRVRKITYGGWNGTTYSSTALTDNKYLYDGWNLVAEFNAISTLTLVKSYTWGLDLTGSLTASGGVGALLQIYDSGASKTLLPAYDGNGNVAALINDSSGTIEAAYEYDPFGRLLRNEGTYSATNTFRFSSKFVDLETDLYCYGLRYYSPTLGRFINKDPIEESGGLNLYGFCSNDGISNWDYLGMFEPGAGIIVRTPGQEKPRPKREPGVPDDSDPAGGIDLTSMLNPSLTAGGINTIGASEKDSYIRNAQVASNTIVSAGIVHQNGKATHAEVVLKDGTTKTINLSDLSPADQATLQEYLTDYLKAKNSGAEATAKRLMGPVIDSASNALAGMTLGVASLFGSNTLEQVRQTVHFDPTAEAGWYDPNDDTSKTLTIASSIGLAYIPLGRAPTSVGGAVEGSIENSIPRTLTRVISGEGPFRTLGAPGSADVFVTGNNLRGLSPQEISQLLAIPPARAYTVIEFPTPSQGLASPILRKNPGFVGGGRTAGGATEFVVPNTTIPPKATIQVIKTKGKSGGL